MSAWLDECMQRRWIIRGLFMLPVLLCIVGWVWGGGHVADVSYFHNGSFVHCSPSFGAVNISFGKGRSRPDGWHGNVSSLDDIYLWPPQIYPHYILGFTYNYITSSAWNVYQFWVPFWALVICFASVFLFVWRRTLPKINPKIAFPIESAKQ